MTIDKSDLISDLVPTPSHRTHFSNHYYLLNFSSIFIDDKLDIYPINRKLFNFSHSEDVLIVFQSQVVCERLLLLRFEHAQVAVELHKLDLPSWLRLLLRWR